jgi:transcriptional regulator with XRE-family HTH domain
MNESRAVADEPSLRERRLAAGITLQAVAERAGVSYSMVQLLDRGYQPRDSPVRTKVMAALDQLEHEALAGQWELTPNEGRSAYRGDTGPPKAAA